MSDDQIPSFPGKKRRQMSGVCRGGMLKLRFDWYISVVYSFIDNDTRHHSGQNVVDSRGAAKPHSICFLPQYQRNEIFVLTIEHTDSDLKLHALHYANDCLYASDSFKNFCKLA